MSPSPRRWKIRSLTSRPPSRCSLTMRSSAASSGQRYQTPSGYTTSTGAPARHATMQLVRVRLMARCGRASIFSPTMANMACAATPSSVQRGPTHMRTCLVCVLIGWQTEQKIEGWTAWHAFFKKRAHSYEEENKRWLRSRAIHLDRPPRYKRLCPSGWFPGSRAARPDGITRMCAFPCMAQWLIANRILDYRCGGSVGLVFQGQKNAPTSHLTFQQKVAKHLKVIAVSLRGEPRICKLNTSTSGTLLTQRGPEAPRQTGAFSTLAAARPGASGAAHAASIIDFCLALAPWITPGMIIFGVHKSVHNHALF